jgi:hypothetical protein
LTGILKRPLDIILVAIAIASAAALFLANEDPFARHAFCTLTRFCPVIPHAQAFAKMLYDLAAGALISILFYVLMVEIPDNQRRRRYQKSLTGQYRHFRRDCIALILGVSDGSYDSSLPEQLNDQRMFRSYFKARVTPDQVRWDRFSNNLDDYHLRALVKRIEAFRDEITFILNNVDVPPDEPFEFLKLLSAAIYCVHEATPENDDIKQFSIFLWELLAGFNFKTGHAENDVFQKMIDSI